MVESGSGGGMEQWELNQTTFDEDCAGVDLSIFVRTMNYQPIKHSFYTPGTASTKEAIHRLNEWMDFISEDPIPEHQKCICVNDVRKGDKCGPGSGCIARDNGYECGPECSVEDCTCLNNEMTRGECDKKMSLISRGTLIGYGVIAQEEIKEDEFLCEYIGECFPEDENPDGKDSLYTSALFDSVPPYEEVSVEAVKYGSKSRFINTSCQPCAKIWTIKVGDTLRVGIYSTTIISPGDEITINYGTRFHTATGLCCRCGHNEKCPDMHKSYPCEQRNENTELLTLGEQMRGLHHRVYGRDRDSLCRQQMRAIFKHAKKRIANIINDFKKMKLPLQEYADLPRLDGRDSLDDKNKLSDFSNSDETFYQKTKKEQRVRRRKRKELDRAKAASDKKATENVTTATALTKALGTMTILCGAHISTPAATTGSSNKSPGKVVPLSATLPCTSPPKSPKNDRPASSSALTQPATPLFASGSKSPNKTDWPPGSEAVPHENSSPKRGGSGNADNGGGSGSSSSSNGDNSAAVPSTDCTGGNASRPTSPMVVSLPSSPRAISPILVDSGVFQFWSMLPPIGQPQPEYRNLLGTSTATATIQTKKKKKTLEKGPEKRKEPEDPKLSPEDKTERKRSKTRLKLKKQPCPSPSSSSSSALDVAPSSQTRATTPTQTLDEMLYNNDSDISFVVSPQREVTPSAANDFLTNIPLVLEEEDMTTSQSASSTSKLPTEPQQHCSSSQNSPPKQQSSLLSNKTSSQENAKTLSPSPSPPSTITTTSSLQLSVKAIENPVEKVVEKAVGPELEIDLEKVIEVATDKSPCKSPENEKPLEKRPQTPERETNLISSDTAAVVVADDDDTLEQRTPSPILFTTSSGPSGGDNGTKNMRHDDEDDDGISAMDIDDPCFVPDIPDTTFDTGDMDADDELDDHSESEDVTLTESSSCAAAMPLESVVPSSTTVVVVAAATAASSSSSDPFSQQQVEDNGSLLQKDIKRKRGRPIGAKNKNKKEPITNDNASATTTAAKGSSLLSSAATRRLPGLRNREKNKNEDVVAPSSSTQSNNPSSTGISMKASRKSKGLLGQMNDVELRALFEAEIAKLTYRDSIGRQYPLARTDATKGGAYGRPANEPWKCFIQDCFRHFTNIPEYRAHLLKQHLKLKDKKCKVCGKGFKTDEELKKHMKTHDPKQPKYECINCGAQYKTAGDLGRHHNKLSPDCNSNFYDVISYDGNVIRTKKRKPDPNLPDPPPLTEAQRTRKTTEVKNTTSSTNEDGKRGDDDDDDEENEEEEEEETEDEP